MHQIQITSDSGEEFEVEEIVERRTNRKGVVEYLVKWKDQNGQCTWENLETLQNIKEMVAEFDKKKAQERMIEEAPAEPPKSTPTSHQKPTTIPELPLHEMSADRPEGNYDDNDSAREVINVRRTGDRLDFMVSWKPRKDQRSVRPSWVSDSEIKLHNPEVLCEYLLMKIKWSN